MSTVVLQRLHIPFTLAVKGCLEQGRPKARGFAYLPLGRKPGIHLLE